jgi:hypothetical protein
LTPVNPITSNCGYVISNATTQSDPFITFYSLRDPTSNDVNFPIQKRWINFTFPREWILENYTNNTGQLQAHWVLLAEGGTAVLTLSDDVGTKVSPDSTGNIQIEGQLNEQIGFFPTTISNPVSHLITTNPMSGARWIVDPLSTSENPNGTATTIAEVNAQAQPGDTVLIMPGTYTENPALIAGVNYVGLSGDNLNPNVIINGECTFSSAGTVTLANISLQTNGSFCLSITGTAASIVNLDNCTINCTNSSGIQYTTANTSSALQLFKCMADTTTNGISFLIMSSTGRLTIDYTNINNSGNNTTASQIFNGNAFFNYTLLISPIITSSLAFFSSIASTFSAGAGGTLNVTPLVVNGISPSGFANAIVGCQIFSGNASGISIGSGASLSVGLTAINSGNMDAIVGGGALIIGAISSPQNNSLVFSNSTIVCAPFNGGRYEASAPVSGTATLVNGAVTINLPTIAANDMIIISRFAANASTALGELSYSTNATVSFTVHSLNISSPSSIQAGDQSSFTYFIVRQV